MIAIILAFVIAFAWGFPPLVHRFLTKTCHVPMHVIMLLSAFTYMLSVGVMVFIRYRHVVIHEVYHHRRWIPLMFVTTFISMFIANILYLYVIKHADNINIVTIITALYPIITVIFAAMFLQEHLTITGYMGFVLVLIGICMMLYKKKN